MFYRPRFLHWLYAEIFGYFWLPCPICGKSFGGHETAGFLAWDDFSGEGVCPQCKVIAAQRNQQAREKRESEGTLMVENGQIKCKRWDEIYRRIKQ